MIHKFFKSIHLIVLFVQYEEKYSGVFQEVKKIIDNLHIASTVYIFINNKNVEEGTKVHSPYFYEISGSNKDREFSGWQRGMEFLKNLNIHYDLVLLINDSCFVYGKNILNDKKFKSIIHASIKIQSIIGQLDVVPSHNILMNYSVSSWLRTNCVLIPSGIMSEVKSVVAVKKKDMASIIPTDYSEKLLYNTIISAYHVDQNSFTLDYIFSESRITDISIEVYKVYSSDSHCAIESTNGDHIFLINDFTLGSKKILEKNIYYGIQKVADSEYMKNMIRLVFDPQDIKIGDRFFFDGSIISNDDSISGYEIRIYKTSPLFCEFAPLNFEYKMHIIHWLGEGWHSRFHIHGNTWDRYREKARAIFNEALFTAHMREKGHTITNFSSL